MNPMRLSKLLLCSVFFSAAANAAMPQDDPLAVNRPNPTYESVLTKQRLQRLVTSYHLHFYNAPRRSPGAPAEPKPAALSERQIQALTDYVRVGMDGPFVPRFIDRFGEATLAEWASKGMKFPYFPPYESFAAAAKHAGAIFFFPPAYGSGEHGVACWDPRMMDLTDRAVEAWLRVNGKKPWLSCIIGVDEPLNYAGTLRSPWAVEFVNQALKQKFPILKLKLTAQDPELVQPWTTTDPGILNKNPLDVALLRIAVWRWLNDQLYERARREYRIVKTYVPQVPYFAYNRNAISILDFMTKYSPNTIDRVDQARYYDVTDGYSADPYPTANLKSQGQMRALYHVGFICKLMTDLGGGKPSKLIEQAFLFHDRMPTPENIREWASQAAKVGVTHLEWYGDPRSEDPALYQAMLRITRQWKELPALDIPKRADVAVIFSDDSRAATNDYDLNAHYLLHYLLGENLGIWYTFVGENSVRKGIQSLDGYKLILAPSLSYVSRSFAEELIAAVRDGATLVVFDPDALTYDIETGPLASQRKELLGTALGNKRECSHFLAAREGQRRFPETRLMLIEPGKSGEIARTLEIPNDARVLFNYEDGTPGVYSRRLGKGEAIVFSAMPLADCGPAYTIGTSGLLGYTGWDTFLATLAKEKNIKTNLPIWRFELPAAAGSQRAPAAAGRSPS
jgi:hypothetical protein